MENFPQGIVEISDEPDNDRVMIEDLGHFYTIFGPPDARSKWQDAYGMDSLGISPDGQEMFAGFPIFSRVAWMHVDPVRIRPEEIDDLLSECCRALEISLDDYQRKIIRDIYKIANNAKELGVTLKFCHP